MDGWSIYDCGGAILNCETGWMEWWIIEWDRCCRYQRYSDGENGVLLSIWSILVFWSRRMQMRQFMEDSRSSPEVTRRYNEWRLHSWRLSFIRKYLKTVRTGRIWEESRTESFDLWPTERDKTLKQRTDPLILQRPLGRKIIWIRFQLIRISWKWIELNQPSNQ